MRRDPREKPGFGPVQVPVPLLGLRGVAESERLSTIVRAAQAGDPPAIHVLVSGLTPPLLQTVRALMGPRHPDIEDLAQDVLLAVIDELPSFGGGCTLLHFAIRIAVRRTTAVRRRSRTTLGWLEKVWQRDRSPVEERTWPDGETISDRRRGLLRTLLTELPEAQAEAMVLRLALGCSIDEIATITSAPIHIVRSRLRLAKDALRSRVEAEPRWAGLWGGEP